MQPGTHLSILTLHGLRYDELAPADRMRARAHLDVCLVCTRALLRQEQARRAFDGARERRHDRVAALFGLAALVLLFPLAGRAVQDTVRSKGSAVSPVVVVTEHAGPLHEGDRIQLRVTAGPWRTAWVADGVDGHILGSFPLHAGHATLSPFALRVDDDPSDDVVQVVLAEDPLTPGELQDALGGTRVAGVRSERVHLAGGSR